MSGLQSVSIPCLIVLALLPGARAAGHAGASNLALGRPVSASSFESDSYPGYAVDGDATLAHWWGANPYPQWLQVDLLSVSRIDELHLFTYWDGNRHYRYTIEASVDGAAWTQVVDMSANTVPSTAAGFVHPLSGVQARFLRVNMLENSANPGVHIVELEVLGLALRPGELEVRPDGPIGFGGQDIHAGATPPVRVELLNSDPEHHLSLHEVTLDGPGAEDFALVADTGEATLGPGAARVLAVAFDPSLPGRREAVLTVRCDDADEGETAVLVAGIGSGSLFGLIPQPARMQDQGGGLALTSSSRIVALEPRIAPHGQVLSDELYLATGIRLGVVSDSPRPGDVLLAYDPALGDEQYALDVTTTVDVRGRDAEALARGTATLAQLVGPDGVVPAVSVLDAPAFPYRALSLDVARKHHSIDVLEQAVELCRFYKIRYLGLHLTDDQNFMFPSTAFPKVDQDNHDQPAYSLAELRALERYAVARGVLIVPELDVPGHSAKLVKLYPQVFGSLSGSTIDFQLPSCVDGVKTLISEMLDVFPSSPYFHIGGDESGFAHLPAFATFVQSLDDHVKAGGRTTLMWEGFAPGAAIPRDILVINWESSYYRPDLMLQAGYTVVNAGWDPLYVVDHYPWVQYTYHTLERLYGFDPYTFGHVAPGYPASNGITVPASSALPGAELCWWEGRGDYAVPILRNRLPAFGARLWSTAGERGFASFARRFRSADDRLEALLFPVRVRSTDAIHDYWKPEQPFSGAATVGMETPLAGTIRYTLDGTEPTRQSPAYAGPLVLPTTTVVKAALFESGQRVGFTTRVGFLEVRRVSNLTTGKPVTVDSPAFIEHPAALVTDGVIEPDSYWSCFPSPASIVIDLGGPHALDGVTVFSHWGGGYSERYAVDLSLDGASWTQVVDSSGNTQPATASGYVHGFSAVSARHVRLRALGNSWFPDGRFPRIVEVLVHEAP